METTAMNVPNLLSISRILAVPVFIVLMLEPTPLRALLAGIVFSIASATDWLDGYLARKWGQVTKIGKLLDPVADKILVASALIMLVDIARIPSWIAIIIIGREIAITGLRAMAASEGIVIAAENMGKWKVGAQITAVLCLVLDYHLGTDWISDVGRIAIFIAMILAVVSGMRYIIDYWKRAG
jgi:CDP-diacylglycerol---glycerol-3-phosphate 3-phosphatidyltransferase